MDYCFLPYTTVATWQGYFWDPVTVQKGSKAYLSSLYLYQQRALMLPEPNVFIKYILGKVWVVGWFNIMPWAL